MSVARLDQVTKDFGAVRGLDDVTLDFAAGEITVLLGASGSGKSTLLRHLNGLHRPSSGQIEVLGRDVTALTGPRLRALRSDIGMIFQSFNLVGPMSVLENVCVGTLGTLKFPRLTLMTYPRRVRAAALESLERVELADRAYQRADTLSGGQAQRVAIARALVQRPRLLLADEPVASLDPRSAQQIIDLLRTISEEDDLTVIASLHQVPVAFEFADRIVGLRDGRVVLDDRAENLTAEDAARIYRPESTI